jgi:carbamoyl-phosphate synthase large subunit
VRAFLEQRNALNHSGKVFSCDLKPEYASACHVSERAFHLPAANSPNYIEELLSLCETFQIGLVVPTIDTELLPLAYNSRRMLEGGTRVSIPDVSLVEQSRDKTLTGGIFNTMGIRYPHIYGDELVTFPAFAKPVSGSSSKGITLIHSESDLASVRSLGSQMMISEYVGSPFIEYTLDSYFDLLGKLICVVPRLRIETRTGEVSKSITRRNSFYNRIVSAIARLQGFRGCVTIQVFFNPETEELIGLEINPRFGGGFPLSYAAGANFPGWLISEVFHQKTLHFFDSWKADLLMLRYDAAVFVENVD